MSSNKAGMFQISRNTENPNVQRTQLLKDLTFWMNSAVGKTYWKNPISERIQLYLLTPFSLTPTSLLTPRSFLAHISCLKSTSPLTPTSVLTPMSLLTPSSLLTLSSLLTTGYLPIPTSFYCCVNFITQNFNILDAYLMALFHIWKRVLAQWVGASKSISAPWFEEFLCPPFIYVIGKKLHKTAPGFRHVTPLEST